MTKKKGIGEKIITPKAMFNYPAVFQPDTEGKFAKGKYKIGLHFERSNPQNIEWLKKTKAICLALAKESWPTVEAKDVKLPFRSGDDEKKKDKPGFAGTIFINVTTKYRPGVVDAKMQEIIDPEEIYSGCFGRASITPFVYETEGKGVSFYLGNIQKLGDGPRIGGGGASAEADFEPVAVAVDEATPFDENEDNLGL